MKKVKFVRLQGGLGNQMFQYAFAYFLHKKGNRVKVDTSFFDYYDLHTLSIFNFKILLNAAKLNEVKKFYLFNSCYLSYKIKTFSLKIFKFLINFFRIQIFFENNELLKKKIFLNKYYYFDGYWQNLEFFDENRKDLINQFQIKKISVKYKNFLSKINRTRNSVAIHFRFYTKIRNEDLYHGNLDVNYYDKAINLIKKKIKDPFFYIFSNSSNSMIKNLNFGNSGFEIVKGFKNFEDLISISNCKHQIISNSTFSWWGAWLNQNQHKVIIVPNKWTLIDSFPNNLLFKRCIKV
jgi:hypothetical protein